VVAKGAGGNSQATYTPDEWPGGIKKGCGPGGTWKVYNDSPFRGGRISLMEATAKSTNTAFIALAEQLGGCKVRDTVMRLGLHRADGGEIPPYAPAYVLGATEVSPQGVAQAYATLASDGKKCPVVAITKITQGRRNLPIPATKCQQVVDPDAVRATDKFLEYNMTHGSGILNQLDDGKRQSAGKTGTANGNNESWFVGYVPQLATAVWVGTPDDGNKRIMKNLRVGDRYVEVMHGAKIAAPIWKGIMNKALDGQPEIKFKEPSDKLLKGDQVDVPTVTGMSVSDAIATLQAAGFSATVGGTMSSSVPNGLVAGTSPYGRAPSGSVITIYTSRGTDRQQPQPQPQTTVVTPGGGTGPTKTRPPKPR
jgi:membrane peptidoglycan carboxypeptidase